jgi:exosortase
LVLPFAAAYLLYLRFSQLRAQINTENFSFCGAALVLVALPLLAAAELTQSRFTSWVAFFPILLGTIALLWGGRVALHASPIALVLFLAKPLPDSVVPRMFNSLQNLAAEGSVWILERLGVPVYLSGNIIEVPGMTLLVEEACSGVRSLLALLSVAAILINLRRTDFLNSITLIGLAVALALIFNIIRVTVTALMVAEGHREVAEGFLHSFSGMVIFILGFFTLLGCQQLFERRR